jgi:chemotaxis methyl-accepting protein methylase
VSKLLLPLPQFRHVIFPSEGERRKRVLNFAVQPEPLGLAVRPEPGLPEEQAELVGWLFREAGLDAGAYRPETLQRRLPACLRGLRARSAAEARRMLERCPALTAKAISLMLVGVTSFFRDPPVFDALEREVLPALLAGRQGLYVWSAGCSDGAELYSVGILLAEHHHLKGSYLLGTDCRADAVGRARAGLFEALACKNVPALRLARHFTPEGGGWRASAALRAALRWRTADLLKVQEPGIWDLILCRNTTMYLRAEAAAPLWQRFESLLRPGGVLVLGRAERPAGAKRLTALGSCLFRRNRG